MWFCKAGAQFVGKGWDGLKQEHENEPEEVFMTQNRAQRTFNFIILALKTTENV